MCRGCSPRQFRPMLLELGFFELLARLCGRVARAAASFSVNLLLLLFLSAPAAAPG